MPVFDNVFTSILNFISTPPSSPPIFAPSTPPPKGDNLYNDRLGRTQYTHRVRKNRTPDGPRSKQENRSRMEEMKRRVRKISNSLPFPPLDNLTPVPKLRSHGTRSTVVAEDAIQRARLPSSSRHSPSPHVTKSSKSASSVSQTSSSKGKGRAHSGGSWSGWDRDILKSLSAENLSELLISGQQPRVRQTARRQQGIKRKRSVASIASTISSSSISRKISGLVSRASKRMKTTDGEHESKHATARRRKVLGENASQLSIESDGGSFATLQAYHPPRIHEALEEGGCRVISTSVNTDDLYTDKPHDAILSVPSIIAQLRGTTLASRFPGIIVIKPDKTLNYHLWAACRTACDLLPFKRGEGTESREERAYLAIQHLLVDVGMAMLNYLPEAGVLHVPVDPRLSNSVVDTVQHTLDLLETFEDAGAPPYRLVFDIPATHAGILAGQILSLEHNLHVNFTHVCDLLQTSKCLESRPYGISAPTRAMKAVRDEGLRAGPIPSLDKVAEKKFRKEKNVDEHSAFETIRAVIHFVELFAPNTYVCAREVDTVESLHALTGVHAISPTYECLLKCRWRSVNPPPSASRRLFFPVTETQRRKAGLRAKSTRPPIYHTAQEHDADSSLEEAAWETALREEIERGAADQQRRYPRVLRRYVDKEWISSCGLSRKVQDLALASQNAPEGFLSSLPAASKRIVLQTMEMALENDCRTMGDLHQFVKEYLRTVFGPRDLGRAPSEEEDTAER